MPPNECSASDVSRVWTYIRMVKNALSQVSPEWLSKEVRRIYDLASLYVKDAEYYLSLGDCITSTSCIAYAEGLLDALRMLGYLSIEWVRERPKRVLVGGTFDIIHPGHIHYLREASKYGLVYAVVARDVNVERIKGRKPVMREDERLAVVSSIRYVYKAVLGHESDFGETINRLRPDLIVLGPDQPVDESFLENVANKYGLTFDVVRLKERVGGQHMASREFIKLMKERLCRE